MARQTVSMTPHEWRTFLDEQRIAVLASNGGGPFPHVVAMWYIPRDDGLFMWTYAKSQKAQNLRREPHVGVLVEAGVRYDELRGVLIQGEVELIEEFNQVYSVGVALHARYASEGTDAAAAEPGIRAQAAKRVLIRIPYTHVVSWDHRKLARR